MSTERKLIIVRHAHRDKDLGHSVDNGISDKGEKQARRILKRFADLSFRESPFLVSSPKRRCIETLDPISVATGVPIKILPDLDEGAGLPRKIESFLKWWRSQDHALVIACSHGDWIPTFVEHASGAWIDLSKGGWIEFESADGQELALRWVLQKP